MSDNVVPLRDPNMILRNAVIEARSVLAIYAEPGGPDAERTISVLMRIFDNPRIAQALAATS